MNVLPVVLPTFVVNLLNGQHIAPEDVCLHKYFERTCLKNKANPEDEQPSPPQPSSDSSLMHMPLWMRQYYFGLLVLIVNLILWLYFSRTRRRKSRRESPFFTMLAIISLSASFRISFSIITIILSACIEDPKSSTKAFLLQCSLYLDYLCNYFSSVLTFWMSLNRCLSFVAKDSNSRLFDGLRVALPVVFSILTAIFGAITSLITSQVQRLFISRAGVVDVGLSSGYREMINRTFFLFPVGSLVCYIIMYYHMWEKEKVALANPYKQKCVEHKVFGQLFGSTMIYVTLYTTFELLAIFNLYDDYPSEYSFQTFLATFNCLPELSLPLFFICSNYQFKKKVRGWLSFKPTPAHSTVNQAPVQSWMVPPTEG